MNRFLPACLSFSLFLLAPVAHSQTNTDLTRPVNRIGAEPQSGEEMPHGAHEGSTRTTEPLPEFSGNLPSTINEDRTHGVNAPGTMIGPSPEAGQPDPRFPNDPRTGGSGGGSEINIKSSSHTTSQVPGGPAKRPGEGQIGGTTSNLNEGLPSASKDNSGGNSKTGSGGPGGEGGNLGGDARPGVGPSRNVNDTSNVPRETAGAAPYALGALVVIIGGFLFGIMRSRAQRRNQ